jgi:hypothetical protein
MARALADAAVGDRRPARIDPFLLQVNRAQLVHRLERPVWGDGGIPGDAFGSGHVPAALGGFIYPRGRDHLARELVGTAHVYQVAGPGIRRLEDVRQHCPQFGVSLRHLVGNGLRVGTFGRQLFVGLVEPLASAGICPMRAAFQGPAPD